MSDPGAWGTGDSASVAGGVIYLGIGWWRIPTRRNFDGFVVLLATGISVAPLLMILVDPLVQKVAEGWGVAHPVHVIELVVNESRITLWWAAGVAAAYLTKDLF